MASVETLGGAASPARLTSLLLLAAGTSAREGSSSVLASVRACARGVQVEALAGVTDLLDASTVPRGGVVLVEVPPGSEAGFHALRILADQRADLPLVALVPPGGQEIEAALGAGACEVLSSEGMTEGMLWDVVERAIARAERRAAVRLERDLLALGIAAARPQDLARDLVSAVTRRVGVDRVALYLRMSASTWERGPEGGAMASALARPAARVIAALLAARGGAAGDSREGGAVDGAPRAAPGAKRLLSGGLLWRHLDAELPGTSPLRGELDPGGEAQTACVLPLSASGQIVAALWMADRRPRAISVEAVNAIGRVAPALATAMKRLREAEDAQVHRSRARLVAAALDTVLMGIDSTGSLVAPEPAWERITGQGFDQARGLGWMDAMHPEDRALAREAMDRPRDTTTLTARLWHAESGAYRYATVRLVPLPEKDGQEAGWVLAVTDAHEEALAREATEALEAQLRQAQRMEAVGRLAGGVAHDLNNLLTVIQGNSYLLSSLALENPSVGDEVKGIQHAARRASELTSRLLTFSRRTSAKIQILDLNAVISDLESILRRVIGEDVDLRFHYAEGLPEVRADPGQVEQILMNLLVNARDAMPGGGLVTVETAEVELGESLAQVQLVGKPGPHVMLAVTDAGVGMDKETQAKIFDPFFTTKDPGKGTGLGLATVYSIVKQSGGHIFVQSAVGEGTTFKVYLPSVDPAEGAGDAGAPRRSRPATARLGGSETVLVAEDDQAVRKMVERILSQGGYQVLLAGDGDDALVLARAHSGAIHLVVADLVMPRMNGMAMVEALLEERADCRVLFMSGYADNAVADRGAIPTRSAFLAKPFTPHQLLVAVRKALDRGDSS